MKTDNFVQIVWLCTQLRYTPHFTTQWLLKNLKSLKAVVCQVNRDTAIDPKKVFMSWLVAGIG